MGAATFVVGLLPGYAIDRLAGADPAGAMRVMQGLALGGEYGGAATYIAEHAPDGRRGFYTSWIQTTATMGIVTALLVILAFRLGLGEEAFGDWGWRDTVPDLGGPGRAVGLYPHASSRNRRFTPPQGARQDRRPIRRWRASAAAGTGASS